MPWTEPLEKLRLAYEELQGTIKRLIWWSVGFGIIMTLLATVAITLSALVVYQRTIDNENDIIRNERTIVALCREINSNNSDLLIVLLDAGIDIQRGAFLFPKNCNPQKLRERFGVPQ